MKTTTRPKTLALLVEREAASLAQGELYRSMAAALRALDPNHRGDARGMGPVSVEVQRLLGMAAELEADADETRDEIAERFSFAEYDAAIR